MKAVTVSLAALIFAVVTVPGQEAPEASPDARRIMELRRDRKGAELMATTPAKPFPAVQQPIIKYEGFLVEWAKAPSPKRKMLDLRQPVRHDVESPNLFRDPATGRARGFVLFAIRF